MKLPASDTHAPWALAAGRLSLSSLDTGRSLLLVRPSPCPGGGAPVECLHVPVWMVSPTRAPQPPLSPSTSLNLPTPLGTSPQPCTALQPHTQSLAHTRLPVAAGQPPQHLGSISHLPPQLHPWAHTSEMRVFLVPPESQMVPTLYDNFLNARPR